MQKKTNHTTNPLILVLIIILGAIVGYVFYSQGGDPEPIPLPARANDPSFVKFKDFTFDFTLFQNESFANLKTYGQVPIIPETTGRQDVFAPWQ